MTAYVPAELRRQVAADAGHRCGYCLSDELLTGVPLTVDHIVPTAKGGTTERDNLWLSCRPCNEFKGIETHALDPQTGELAALFNPRHQTWTDHFAWSSDGTQVAHRSHHRSCPEVEPAAFGPRMTPLGRGRLASAG